MTKLADSQARESLCRCLSNVLLFSPSSCAYHVFFDFVLNGCREREGTTSVTKGSAHVRHGCAH